DALRCYLDGIQFGNEISRGGFVIHRLVGIACEAIAEAGLSKLMPGLECEQARQAIAGLEQVDRAAVPWEEVARMERVFMRYEARKYSANPVRLVVDWWQARTVIKSAKARHDQSVARRRLIMTELALRCYQAELGNAPARLEN